MAKLIDFDDHLAKSIGVTLDEFRRMHAHARRKASHYRRMEEAAEKKKAEEEQGK